MDQNGNYIIQLVLQYKGKVTQECHQFMFKIIMDSMYYLSVHKNGCRVVQTGFDVFTLEQQEMMIECLMSQNKIKDLSFDFNGNHVVQKILIKIKNLDTTDLYQRFIKEIDRNVLDYSMHEYCCRII